MGPENPLALASHISIMEAGEIKKLPLLFIVFSQDTSKLLAPSQKVAQN
jgi:hypothetical protein